MKEIQDQSRRMTRPLYSPTHDFNAAGICENNFGHGDLNGLRAQKLRAFLTYLRAAKNSAVAH
jgi:hypothetical protein